MHARVREGDGYRAIEGGSNAGIMTDRKSDHSEAVASDDLEVHRLGGVVDVPLVRSGNGELHASWPIDLAV